MSADPARDAVLAVARSTLNLPAALPALGAADEAAIARFANEPATMLLSIFAPGAPGGALRCSNEAAAPAGAGAERVHLVKLRAMSVDGAAALASAVVVSSSAAGSPLASLHAALRSVYGPSLLQDPHWQTLLDEGTRKVLSELDARIALCLQQREPGSAAAAPAAVVPA
jgi:hypothetical protein